jgi:hypothetical protein
LLLAHSVPGHAHGVERGSVWDAIQETGEGLTPDSKKRIYQQLEQHCVIEDVVEAEAEAVWYTDPAKSHNLPNRNLRFELQVLMADEDEPVSIVVEALRRRTRLSITPRFEIKSIESPICR